MQDADAISQESRKSVETSRAFGKTSAPRMSGDFDHTNPVGNKTYLHANAKPKINSAKIIGYHSEECIAAPKN